MENLNGVEIFGYLGSFLVALSLTMGNMFWLRVFNLAGAIIFVVYGMIIKSYPVVALNLFLTFVNIYHLYKLNQQKST